MQRKNAEEIKNKYSFKPLIVDARNINLPDDQEVGSKADIQNLQIKLEDGRTLRTSGRFWRSIAQKGNFSTNIFRLFKPSEVWKRLCDLQVFGAFNKIRIVEDVAHGQVLAASSLDKSHIDFEEYLAITQEHDGGNYSYHNGIVSSMHPIVNNVGMTIAGEEYEPRIVVNTPIDGYGQPHVYPSLMRRVCENGMVAFSNAFRTEVNVSKSDKNDSGQRNPLAFNLNRLFDTFSNDEGYDAIARRLEAARKTPLSLAEAERFTYILNAMPSNQKKDSERTEIKRWYELLGNFFQKYGITANNSLTTKQMSMLPTCASVYDAITFLTEIGTHRLNKLSTPDMRVARSLNSEIGTLITKPGGFDLEGTDEAETAAREVPDFYLK